MQELFRGSDFLPGIEVKNRYEKGDKNRDVDKNHVFKVCIKEVQLLTVTSQYR